MIVCMKYIVVVIEVTSGIVVVIGVLEEVTGIAGLVVVALVLFKH